MSEPRITAARIEYRAPQRSSVYVTIDGQQYEAVRFYSDELHFSPDEFIGLTLDQARQLWMRRDTEYLQRP